MNSGSSWGSSRWVVAAICLSSLVFLSGCVERLLLVRSDPSGARVFVDAHDMGVTPVEVPFEHYGTREVLLRKSGEDSDEPGHESVVQLVELKAPWYQWFPFDIFSELLWPGTIRDVHEVMIPMPPLDTEALQEKLEQTMKEQTEQYPDESSSGERP